MDELRALAVHDNGERSVQHFQAAKTASTDFRVRVESGLDTDTFGDAVHETVDVVASL